MSRTLAPLRFGSLKARPPPALPGQRIGVMGGSFNPPHGGHVAISKSAIRRLRLDRLWWVVTPGNPLKPKGGVAPLHERMAACRRLVTDPRIKVTAFEADLGSPYTAVTLGFLHRRFPGTGFVWVMGADNLATFHRWQDWRGIARTMAIAVVDRPGWRLKALASPAARALQRGRVTDQRASALPRARLPAWAFIDSRLSSLSSSEIRARRGARDELKQH
jgi:nicotinate-nucleotide adenylyltransferase